MYRIDIVILTKPDCNYLSDWGKVIVYVWFINTDSTETLFILIFT
jgi:hypothetical protein